MIIYCGRLSVVFGDIFSEGLREKARIHMRVFDPDTPPDREVVISLDLSYAGRPEVRYGGGHGRVTSRIFFVFMVHRKTFKRRRAYRHSFRKVGREGLVPLLAGGTRMCVDGLRVVVCIVHGFLFSPGWFRFRCGGPSFSRS